MRATGRGSAALGLVVALCLGPSSLASSDDARADDVVLAPRTAAVTVGLVADVQYCDCDPKGTRFYRSSLAKLSRAAEVFDERAVDVTVQVGDLIDRRRESFDRVLPVYGRIDGPRYHVLGNHDFPMPSDDVVERLQMPGEYYHFSRPGWRFVVLDTNDISLYANEVGTADYERAQQILDDLRGAGAPNAKTFNGAAGKQQVAWLRNVLADARADGQRVLVFGHMPVHGEGAHNAWDDDAIRGALQSSGNVMAYVNGHDHAGGYARQRGIHYLGLRGMVEESPTSNAFSILHLGQRVLRVEGFGREPDRTLDIAP